MITDRKTANRPSTSRQSFRKPSNPRPVDQTPIIPEANFVTDFLTLCEDYGAFPLPEFHIIAPGEDFKISSKNPPIENPEPLSSRLNSKSTNKLNNQVEKSDDLSEFKQKSRSEFTVTVFSLIYDDRARLDAPKDLRCKGFEVNIFMLDALSNCANKFTTITTLKLQRCSINAFGIVQISEMLAAESGWGIKDLNLDGNPNIKQNFHLLCAPETRLLYLSLKLCGINDDGVARIASNLSHRDEPQAPKLIVLNLANNHISETGGKFIGSMLRTNRSLQSLTLTGNRINDDGAKNILEQLSTFSLTQSEVIEKRRRKMNRLKLLQEKMDNLSSEALRKESLDGDGKEKGGAGNRVSKKRRASSRQVISNSRGSSVNRSTPVMVQSLEEKAEAMIPVDTHPLVKDIFSIDGTLSCPGNFKLQHLNLSFNKIGEDTLQRIINCLKDQRVTSKGDITKGLRYIDVEGNDFGKSCELALQLNAIINNQRQSTKFETKIQR